MYQMETVYVAVPVAPPPVYTPPPPAPPPPTVTLSRCTICGALLGVGVQADHTEWHRANGLHGARCHLMVRMAAAEGSALRQARAECTCGLVPAEEIDRGV